MVMNPIGYLKKSFTLVGRWRRPGTPCRTSHSPRPRLLHPCCTRPPPSKPKALKTCLYQATSSRIQGMTPTTVPAQARDQGRHHTARKVAMLPRFTMTPRAARTKMASLRHLETFHLSILGAGAQAPHSTTSFIMTLCRAFTRITSTNPSFPNTLGTHRFNFISTHNTNPNFTNSPKNRSFSRSNSSILDQCLAILSANGRPRLHHHVRLLLA